MRRLFHPAPTTETEAGFTVIELMIATVVFSVILITITYGVMRFTNSYYKGVNSSTTQTTAQNAVDAITQAIQFGSDGTTTETMSGNEGVFCAGSKLFIYTLGKQYDGATPNDGNWGLYMIDNPNTAGCAKPSSPSNGTELLAKNMRVANFDMTQPGLGSAPSDPWQVSLRIAYGDADLLCSQHITQTQPASTPGTCATGGASYAHSPVDTVIPTTVTDLQCKPQTGSQFCSVATLTAVAQQRIVH
jgi:prepilin-type N-terminal cleavage/methylation domain-containing protein